MIRILLLCLSLMSIPAVAEEWGVSQLMQSLAQVHTSRAKFVERKFLSVLNKPLEFSGTLLFEAPDHLEKRTLLPKEESLILNQGVLTIENKSRNLNRKLVLQEYPAVWAFVESIRSTLAGDQAMLERFYTIKIEGDAAKWRMQLLPVERKTREAIREIMIAGQGDRVSSIEINESNGDHSLMTVTEQTP